MEQIQLSESFAKINEYRRNAHSVGISIWHFELCTKYRYKMMRKEEYCALMNGCIRNVAFRNKIKILVLEVLPEHVHCEVEIEFSMAPSKALQILKGGSARIFFKRCTIWREVFLRNGWKLHLWSPGKFFRSVGCVTAEVVENYIRNSNNWEFEFLKKNQTVLSAY